MVLKRIGLLGGTFNPVHLGHLRAALEIRQRLGLDGIWLIPAFLPPHKRGEEVADAAARLSMLKLAAEGTPGFTVSDAELKRAGRSYTIDTLTGFIAASGEDTIFHLIIGLDAFLDMGSWKSHEKLFRLTPVIVMARPDSPGENAPLKRRIETFLAANICREYRLDESGDRFVHPALPTVHYIETTPLSISSTMIRALVKAGRSIRFLVPEKVEDYILRKGLYL